ncbi:hypothetical protein F5878DRAFT_302012 [Lentinula raphanica]|uniref:Uncharacterized protein n=1 Tax=Lentinula raphanica TaxID=153919 RepID=A0AA38PI00_9AGAR|nr:hypothetical protein F5880DRAFT_707300 [Lentinula raphanica]KAJ3843292.1 hypothetical protein F5878DRAFT_302012 [Lentinula raphanica]
MLPAFTKIYHGFLIDGLALTVHQVSIRGGRLLPIRCSLAKHCSQSVGHCFAEFGAYLKLRPHLVGSSHLPVFIHNGRRTVSFFEDDPSRGLGFAVFTAISCCSSRNRLETFGLLLLINGCILLGFPDNPHVDQGFDFGFSFFACCFCLDLESLGQLQNLVLMFQHDCIRAWNPPRWRRGYNYRVSVCVCDCAINTRDSV